MHNEVWGCAEILPKSLGPYQSNGAFLLLVDSYDLVVKTQYCWRSLHGAVLRLVCAPLFRSESPIKLLEPNH